MTISNTDKHKKILIDTLLPANNLSLIYSIVNSGAYRIINGTCAHSDSSTSTLAQEGKCPELRDIDLKCNFNSATKQQPWLHTILMTIAMLGWTVAIEIGSRHNY